MVFADHLVRYKKDREELGADVADLLVRVSNLEKGGVEKLLDATLTGRNSKQQAAEDEQDEDGEDADTKLPPSFSKAFAPIAYDDTIPAPRQEIEAHSKKGLLGDTRFTDSFVSRLVCEYVRDHGINDRRRKKKKRRADAEFLVLSQQMLKALPAYPFTNEYFVYRCVDFKTQSEVFWFNECGKLFQDRGFTSACAFTPDQQWERADLSSDFFSMNAYIAIRSKSGRLIRPFVKRDAAKREWEVLFCYDTTFKILSFKDTKPGEEHRAGDSGRYRIVMEEVSSLIPGLKMAPANEE